MEVVTRHVLAWLMLLGVAIMATPSHAQPDLTRRIGTTVADSGVAGWRFEGFQIESADGQRRYHIRIAVPDATPPEAGFPAVYLLDGNAALMETDAALLQDIAHSGHPHALVYLSYDNDLRIDADARAFDYTPRRPGDDAAQRDVMSERRTGGADDFLDLLQTRIVPQAESVARLDPARRTLWGHSYGGLFVLHTLFSRPHIFASYAAADPSLWWGEGHLLKEETAAAPLPNPAPALWLWVGDGDERAPPPATPMRDPAAVEAMRKARASVPPDATPRMAQRLRERGLDVHLETLTGQSHGQTLGGSLHRLMPLPAATRNEASP